MPATSVMPAASVPTRIENMTALDGVAAFARDIVHKLPEGRVKDALHGLWMGHPLHPVLAQGALGAWISAGILDLTGGQEDAARRLVGAGLLAAVPTALSGAVDW